MIDDAVKLVRVGGAKDNAPVAFEAKFTVFDFNLFPKGWGHRKKARTVLVCLPCGPDKV
jgi:hypothetical protein